MADALEARLRSAVRGEVRFDELYRRLYATDASLYELLPRAVVLPRDRADLEAACRAVLAAGVPLLMRGGGTSLAGQTVNDAVVVDTSKYCNKLLDLDVARRTARVQPGLVLDNLNAALTEHGLWFPPDVATSAQATIGGMIGNNSAGARSILYGMTVDHVLELDVMLADGSTATLRPLAPGQLDELCAADSGLGRACKTVRQVIGDHREQIDARFPKIMRRVSGYALDRVAATGEAMDLTRLIVGSEGTLAVILEAKIDLVPLPRAKGLTVVHFDSLIDAAAAVPGILQTSPSAVELTDKWMMDQTRGSLGYQRLRWWIQGDPAATLIVEYHGDDGEQIKAKIAALKKKLAGEGIAGPFSDALTAAEQADVWAVRKAGLGLLMGAKGARKPLEFLEDCGVPVEHLADYVARWQKIVADEDTRCAFYAHASVGVLHIRPFLDPTDPADIARQQRIAERVTDMVIGFGGSISGEHGDGRSRSQWLQKMYGQPLVEAFAQVKRAFDPKGLLNPGIIVEPAPADTNLRHGPGFKLAHVETMFDYSAEGGFEEAVTVCNGQGLCRKTLTGSMCPTYMVTMEEINSTRGRANALRAMLSGRLQVDWTDDRLLELLDSCLSCKGCKGECPSNVDLAKLKAEFLHQRYKRLGKPLKAKVFGRVQQSNRLGSAFAPLSNWVMSLPPARWAVGRLLKLDTRRSMPPYARRSLLGWWKRHQRQRRNSGIERVGQRQVVLFPDCFATYNEPAVGRAAVEVLEAAGYEVILGPKICCGRAMVSQGLLDEAKATLARVLDGYGQFIDAGLPVLGIEPSCITMFRDELLALHPDQPRAKALARQSFMIEEFLSAEAAAGRLALPLRKADKPIVVHGHCQAKALVGTGYLESVLKLIPEAQVRVLDDGCCGMAGSFGYMKGHYEMSMAIGERVLFPSVREATAAGAVISAAGTSCRHQIHDGTAAHALHPVQILANHLQKRAVQ